MPSRVLIAARAGAVGTAVRRALAAAGLTVVDSTEAQAAVAAAAREHPDVCLLDAGLPGGALVAAAAIAAPPAPPAVVVLGDGGAPEERAAELAGADAYVRRGADDRLVDTVVAAVRRRRGRRNG